MKKNFLMLFVLALAIWTMLPGCGTGAEKNPELQAPETTQTETPAANDRTAGTVAPTDTTTKAENPQGEANEKKTGKDSDDDDDDDKK